MFYYVLLCSLMFCMSYMHFASSVSHTVTVTVYQHLGRSGWAIVRRPCHEKISSEQKRTKTEKNMMF